MAQQPTSAPAGPPTPPDNSAELDSLRLIGKAYYENGETPPQFEPAVEAFRRCTQRAPDAASDRFNLGLALMRAERYDESLAALQDALRIEPDLLAAAYVAGIVNKRLSRAEEAVALLERVTSRDPQCAGAFYNLGVCYKLLNDNERALAAFKRAVELAPTHPSYHYQLMTLYRQLGDVENVKRHKEIFDQVKETVDESEKTAEALERSKYSSVIDAPRRTRDLIPNPGAKVRFVPVHVPAGLQPVAPASQKAAAAPLQFNREAYEPTAARDQYLALVGGAVALADFDGDADLDIYVVNCGASPEASANRLLRNDGAWRFEDVTDAFGVGDRGLGTCAVFGDYDNDGNQDLYVVNCGPNVLYHKQGNGAYRTSPAPRRDATSQPENASPSSNSPDPDCLAVLQLENGLPTTVRIAADAEILEATGTGAGVFIIFDYRGLTDYKFAGGRLGGSGWMIGRCKNGWTVDAAMKEAVNPEQPYSLELRIVNGRAELLVLDSGNWVSKVAHEFSEPLNQGRAGLAVQGAVARFDNLTIRSAPADAASDQADGTVLYNESFIDGTADRCEPVAGVWEVVDWRYDDVSPHARVGEPQFGRKAVFADYDHDNDLDILVANELDFAVPPDKEVFRLPADLAGQLNSLLRNNGDGTFSDRTDEAQLLTDFSQSVDVLPADFDGDADLDLFIVNADAASLLMLNARMGRFEPGGAFDPPIAAGARAAALGEFNRDGRLDLIVAVGRDVRLYLNDGDAKFSGRLLSLPAPLADVGVERIRTCDYNNDGWTDVLLAAADAETLCLLAGTGPGQFHDVSPLVGLDGPSQTPPEDTAGDSRAQAASRDSSQATDADDAAAAAAPPPSQRGGSLCGKVADFAVGDLDGDGDEDVVIQTRDNGLTLLRNNCTQRADWLNVKLLGRKVNRDGYGATVEIAAGGHYQKQVVCNGWTHFGLGDLTGVDVVRVTWPNGVTQNVIEPPINATLEIQQHVKVSASCAFLYAFNGETHELINEILGIGPLGVPMAPGVYYQPDCTELTKIAGDELIPDERGVYELRLTEELRETTYADQITLRVVDHPCDFEIVPNEYFTAPPFPEDRFYAFAERRPPRSAVDDQGLDVLERLLRHDDRVATFPLVEQYDGLAAPHSLTLDLGDLSGADEIVLCLDGWIYWAESSSGMAIAQDPRYELTPLQLEVKDAEGRWQTAIESVGLPTSKGLVVPVVLTGRFPSNDYHVRLSTTMCVYFDRVFVATRDRSADCRMTELPVAHAELHGRGFSAMTRDALGYERFDYAVVSPTGNWNPAQGLYTKFGDVTELLASPDDRYVIFASGDELILRFDGAALPSLPTGWSRDYIFYANGWVKDGDLNTKFSETIEPLPFHGMSSYPYPADEAYPDTPQTRRYRETYNTRPGRLTIGELIQREP